MKKLLSCLISGVVLICISAGALFSASAETAVMEPDYPFHGNVCGETVIIPAVDRDIHIAITQSTIDGGYKYYDTVIPASGEADSYTFPLEGSRYSEVYYILEIGVPKYLKSDEYQTCTYTFRVDDTEYIADDVSKYVYEVTVKGDSDAQEAEITALGDQTKDENNVVKAAAQAVFPAVDVMIGDVDVNREINIFDAVLIAKHTVGSAELNPLQLIAANVNGDEKVNIFDAVSIAKYTISGSFE